VGDGGCEKKRCGAARGGERWKRKKGKKVDTGEAGKNVPNVEDTDTGPLRPAHCLQSYHDIAPREAVETKSVNAPCGYEERRAEPDKRWRDDLRCSVSSISAFAVVLGQCVACGTMRRRG
jgi:hypothetical protein